MSSAAELSPAAQAVVAQELRLLAQVREAVLARSEGWRPWSAEVDYGNLRELREAAFEGSTEDVPALLTQMRVVQQQARRAQRAPLPDLRAPYFAHVRLRAGDHSRDLLLGDVTFLDGERAVTVVDWRTSPMASVFFHHRQGDVYEGEFSGRLSEGCLELRRILAFEEGELRRIVAPEGVLQCGPDGRWRHADQAATPRLAGQAGGAGRQTLGSGATGGANPVVTALLDERQFEALQGDAGRPLLILGSAGCGKTTVALHRMALLAARQPTRFPPERMAVVVPQPGLVRLIRLLLRELGLRQVAVETYDDWVAQQAQVAFRRLPRHVSHDTPYDVLRFKRHPAYREALPRVVARLRAEIGERLDRFFARSGHVPALLEEAAPRHRHLLGALQQVERRLLAEVARRNEPDLRQMLRRARQRLDDVHLDREAMLLDRELLLQVVRRSGGELTEDDVEAVLEHSHVQLGLRTGPELGDGVDAGRMRSLDGRQADEHREDPRIHTMDVEDLALLFELQRLKVGGPRTRFGGLPRYALLLLDEAQDLAPAELRVLGQSVAPKGTLLVAGDAAQQVDPSAAFTSWEALLEDVGAGGQAHSVTLQTAYRSPRPIAEYAHAILGPLGPAEPPEAVRDGPPVLYTPQPNLGRAVAALSEGLADLLDREPRATVAVICRHPDGAADLHRVLESGLPARLVREGDFTFGPGIEVTDVAQVKGLEFDYVVIPDASPSNYPDTPASRRALHVAATRAIQQLWVISVARPAPILPLEPNEGG